MLTMPCQYDANCASILHVATQVMGGDVWAGVGVVVAAREGAWLLR